MVATVLTVYGIETAPAVFSTVGASSLQQYLPFTVLKLSMILKILLAILLKVATVLTVYGIETRGMLQGIPHRKVATVLTVYGIETEDFGAERQSHLSCNSTYRLRY